MPRGKWKLRYTAFDSYENHAPVYTEVIDLVATTEDDALREAVEKCPKMRTRKGWDDEFYPRDPVLAYETPLDLMVEELIETTSATNFRSRVYQMKK